jgi:glycosyltransferase involved in cell wall biosynthesis
VRLTFLTPGTGSFFCGSCLRDHALARALSAAGHEVSVVPLYLPHVVEDADGGALSPRGTDMVLMGGINMYLQQKSPAFARLPSFLRRLLDSPGLLRWASRRGGMTEAAGLGAMTVSMLRGEIGRQAAEVENLVTWLRRQPRQDVLVLSNAMLVGSVRRLKHVLGVPVVVTLQGEQPFLDELPEPFRSEAWRELAVRSQDVDCFVPVSATYGRLMTERLALDADRVRVVHNGIELAGHPGDPPPLAARTPPTLGFFARLCRDKGITTFVDIFLELARRDTVPGLRMVAAGVALQEDRPLLDALRSRLQAEGLSHRAEFHVDVSRARKLALLARMNVLSVPALYGESFGLYLLEALASGVPVVQPRAGAFEEIVAATGGGVCTEPTVADLADAIEALLLDPPRAQAHADAGRRAVRERFHAGRMAEDFLRICTDVLDRGGDGFVSATTSRSDQEHA